MNATVDVSLRFDWRVEEIVALHDLPLLDLIARANAVHRALSRRRTTSRRRPLLIKTGGCPEDCGYCPQSAHHREVHLDQVEMLDAARRARRREPRKGSRRRSLLHGRGLAQRPRRREFDAVLDMVRGVRALGMEACVTLGMLNEAQARAADEAGLTAYNHNLDTEPGVLRRHHHHADL